MAGDRVNAIMDLISNTMIAIGAALLMIGLVGMILAKTEDEEGGIKHDNADH